LFGFHKTNFDVLTIFLQKNSGVVPKSVAESSFTFLSIQGNTLTGDLRNLNATDCIATDYGDMRENKFV